MRGGILADGMGLGKTLTMITSIVATLGLAADFAAGNHSSSDPASPPVMPAKSTLVIVPSTREFSRVNLFVTKEAEDVQCY